jgi:hypothetical protein
MLKDLIIHDETKKIFGKDYNFKILKNKNGIKFFVNNIASQPFRNQKEFKKRRKQFFQKLKKELKINDEEAIIINAHINIFASNLLKKK